MPTSYNFEFLAVHDRQLVRLGALAEQYFPTDPNTCLIKLRQFGELLAELVAAKAGLYEPELRQVDLLRRLRDQGILRGDVDRLFHELRIEGNKATHGLEGNERTALSCLRYARWLGTWFHRTFTKNPAFDPGPFLPPPNPVRETEALKTELERLRQEIQQGEAAIAAAQLAAQTETERRIAAETLATEIEAQRQAVEAHLKKIQEDAKQQSQQVLQQTVEQAQSAEVTIVLDERETRRLIDQQLRRAGWEVDSEELTYAKGTRPQKGQHIAISEYPTRGGRADYALFVGLQIVAVVEAKRQSTDVAEGALNQAKRYSRGFEARDGILSSGTWGEYHVPFVFATNGRPFLQQIQTKSGIWFCDLRRPSNLRCPLQTWYSPQGLIDALAQDVDEAHIKLSQEGFNYGLELRDYQIRAIHSVEAALATGARKLLVAMATGTGKTKTCIALVYRLLKAKRFRRILFLVDRTALGEQTENAFKESRMENLQTFTDIFDLKTLKDTEPDRDTKVHVATVQSLVKRILYPTDESAVPTADQYDCIVVDECHRGYLLDRELSDEEIEFRDFDDYVSKYRRVLEQFDAVKIGLTATPALHTTQIFGDPVYTYSYREAVIDGWLIDHEPPFRIRTALSEDGMVWKPGDRMEFFNPQTGELDLVHAPDEVRLEIEQFNKQVVTEEFNRVVCEAIAPYLDPALPEKTLIFCVTDDHADIVVRQLRKALADQYGSVDDEAVQKITGKADKPSQWIRRFRNEVYPKVAVTVDLLTTGIDVPSICNLVFIRRVNSRILYEQMLGRATRLCDGKEVFRIFDAVDLYTAIAPVSSMKPIAVDPKLSFTQLVNEIGTVQSIAAVESILDQLLAKLQRKRRHLSETQLSQLEAIAGVPVADLVGYLKQQKPDELRAWFEQRQSIGEILDRKDGGVKPILISYHADELRGIERGYGTAERPQDYLESFRAFLLDNLNKVPALIVVTQRPRDLTRSQLKEIRFLLDSEGYTEKNLQVAWQETTNEDIAASIIGFIRQAALGDALIPYSERVDRAMRKILASRSWTPPQRRWLERIGKQLKVEVIVDRESFDQGAFKADGGGFERLNKMFNGQLDEIVVEIREQLWEDVS
ncbi:type I restriction enzyme EcoKI subunit R [Leptolyngbya boryana NIES-2135]|jgi:type I restriction enzyme R subunit|uniref:Type I restriction enzyme EcoKI subunit R n=1 Tax=Leptolyngbya boryana NIES-2135 TaxID=1973484 RepID=A0A1Z4JG84_LEPBY|nr:MULTISPECIES: type I restriction-modification system endonuclease [Leptolyngbya]BAY55795.1 type I restriction enzyme EcoKI subunit R [Leptolyngbya boryana NIES-2135]MBD2368900.1 type I restriction-modification system endonuclease [Leptolyngbya sp. FACHB-161]MBD2375232.1 type I restriction-modification system endonuclease [Leptolyngbya sp. FACHB-238]MBD2399650.1 type I restriction-modification system endonuclease [Leptolyngbya sp. FACHB-239]MBD2405856.1 type I restriction-modification system